jgi:hypothetical protein
MGGGSESIGTGMGSVVVETIIFEVGRGTKIVFVCEGTDLETRREMDLGETFTVVVTSNLDICQYCLV